MSYYVKFILIRVYDHFQPRELYSLSDKFFGRSLFEVSVFRRKTETSNALAWFCQTKVWTPFSEKL